MGLNVFISYSTRDLPTVKIVQSMLTDPEISVFVAEYDLLPGKPMSDTMITKIRQCDLFILLWSANAMVSEWVPQEIGLAKGCERQILPVVLQRGLRLPGFISDLKYLDVPQNPSKALAWLQAYVAKRADEKRTQGLAWLAVGSALLWLISQSGSSSDE